MVCKYMKQPKDISVVSAIDTTDDGVIEVPIEEHFTVETQVALIINFDDVFKIDDVETLNALQRMGSHSYYPKKLDLDLKNRSTPPVKPSFEEPHVLELKQLPSSLRYMFLDENNTSPVVVAADLYIEQVQALVKVVRRFKKTIGWTIVDIIGTPPGICTYKIQLEEDCPSTEHQIRLNPSMQEVVKKEIIKWLYA